MPNEIESLRSVSATLKARRQSHVAELEKLDSVIAVIENELMLLESAPADVQGESRSYTPSRRVVHASGIYSKMAVGNAAVHYLKSKGITQTTKSIVEALVAGGQSAKTKNRYRLVYNILAARARRENNPDVEKDGTGWKYRPPQHTD
jgi:hypothetical protein